MMKMRTTLLIAFLFFGGCYTILKHPEIPATYNESQTNAPAHDQPQLCIVEGIVAYSTGGGTREIRYPRGFVLTRCKWVLNPPPDSRGDFYLRGSIDSSYIHKHVRVEGTFHNSGFGYIQIERLELLN